MKNISVVSYNVNGIRAAMTKGFVDWLNDKKFDIVCLQEIKAMPDQFDTTVFEKLGYHCAWKPAEKKGYSGTAVLSKLKPDAVITETGMNAYDAEGRFTRMDIGDTTFISSYFPSGTTGDVRQDFKYKFLNDFYNYITELKKTRKKILVSGDYNICHKAIDIHDPVSNKDSSGFLPDERKWMDDFFASGWTDAFRKFNQQPHQYTWWSFRANARNNNKGWRIDYHSATNELASQLQHAEILPDAKHSDHCPVVVQLDF